LEARGLVRRRQDPADARSIRVELTAAGRRRVDSALADLVEREDAILGILDAPERALLAALLRRVVAPFDAYITCRTRCCHPPGSRSPAWRRRCRRSPGRPCAAAAVALPRRGRWPPWRPGRSGRAALGAAARCSRSSPCLRAAASASGDRRAARDRSARL